MTSVIKELLELVYPEKHVCFLCGYQDLSIHNEHLCASCQQKMIKLEQPLCHICSKPLAEAIGVCRECVQMPKEFERAIAVYSYEGTIKQTISDFKYHGKSYLYKIFSWQMVELLKKENLTDFDQIVPVPLHSYKEVKRGYNQSKLLARDISSNLGMPMVELVKRTKKTKPQNKLATYERWHNMTGAIDIKKSKKVGKKILLVDDIYTTGATMNACAKVLKREGASIVIGISIAR